ncbi:MAG: hypothetical protein IIU92_03365 [Bacteroidaceae bacterium]|nr:hypothetical protein [Bacteroidaceae bacterium]
MTNIRALSGNEVKTSETVFQVEIKSPTEADSQRHASILPSGLQGRKSATCRLPKLLVSNCQSSAEKLPDFSAEVAEVLLSVVFLSGLVRAEE